MHRRICALGRDFFIHEKALEWFHSRAFVLCGASISAVVLYSSRAGEIEAFRACFF